MQTIEELSMNAWPALQTMVYDGWILRFADGYTRRANCIMPLYPSQKPVAEKVLKCEAIYQGLDMPVIYKMAGRTESAALDAELASYGYRAEADTSVQALDLNEWAAQSPSTVRLATDDDGEWQAAYQRLNHLNAHQHETHMKLLRAMIPDKVYAAITVDGQIAACGLGVLEDGYLGIFDIFVDPNCRKNGFGEQIMRGLLGWGKQQGAHTSYLQVMLNNPPALSLYGKLGYREMYQYWYRVKP